MIAKLRAFFSETNTKEANDGSNLPRVVQRTFANTIELSAVVNVQIVSNHFDYSADQIFVRKIAEGYELGFLEKFGKSDLFIRIWRRERT